MPPERPPSQEARIRAARIAEEQRQLAEYREQPTRMVDDMRTKLTRSGLFYSTTEQLQRGLHVNESREAHVNRHAARLGESTYSENEELLALASEQALALYTASQNAYNASGNSADYRTHLRDGTVYVALRRQMQDMLEKRLDEIDARNTAIAHAARATLPHDSEGTSREQSTSSEPSRAYSQPSNKRRKGPGK